MTEQPRTLLIDIETAPSLAYVWSLWDENVNLERLVESTTMLCFASKWLGRKGVEFYSQHHHGHREMVEQAHRLLSEADVVMHFNGKRFDVPHLNREFLEAGLGPPDPFQQIDLFQTAKRQFKFPSNKLAYIGPQLGVGAKVKHEGFELWTKCMAGDDAAWSRMRRYNVRDVTLLEELYEKLQPWVVQHPSWAAFTGTSVCPACGSGELEKRGFAYTSVSKFQRFRCKRCGKFSRTTKRESGTTVTAVAA